MTVHTVTGFNSAKHSENQAKFCRSSIIHDTTDNQYVRVDAHAAWDFGTGPFSIDLWVYPTVIAAFQHIIGLYSQHATGSNLYWNIITQSDGKLQFRNRAGTTSIISTNAITINSWNHIRVTRDSGGTTRLWLNGTHEGSTTAWNGVNLGSNNHLYIGRNVAGGSPWQFSGYIDEVAIWKGLAISTGSGSITPPTVPWRGYVCESTTTTTTTSTSTSTTVDIESGMLIEYEFEGTSTTSTTSTTV